MSTRKSVSVWILTQSEDKENIPHNSYTSGYFPPTTPLTVEPSTACAFKNNVLQSDSPLFRSKDTSEIFSPVSSGYGSSPNSNNSLASSSFDQNGFGIFNDEFCSSFSSLLKPLQSYTKDQTANSSLSYSLLSSFNFSDIDSLNFDSTPPKNPLHDNIRKEFEQNGRTLDLCEISNEFIPSASSTPGPSRTLQQRFVPSNSWHRSNTQKKKKKPSRKSLENHCVFCKNNGEFERVYLTHTVKDAVGKVLCPILRQYRCPICGEKGDKSHTVKYCPQKPIITLEDIERMGDAKKNSF